MLAATCITWENLEYLIFVAVQAHAVGVCQGHVVLLLYIKRLMPETHDT
jgi:hypothetical protein